MQESSPPPSPSRRSSGCQSGWTLYLDHSVDLETGHRRWTPPRADAEVGCDDDDSMVSDASSGPPPPRLHLDDDAPRRVGGEQECRRFSGQRCYLGSSASASVRSYGSWSRALQDQGRRLSRGAVAEEAARWYRQGDSDDDLDDTASSSAVLGCRPVAAVVYIGPAESATSTVL